MIRLTTTLIEFDKMNFQRISENHFFYETKCNVIKTLMNINQLPNFLHNDHWIRKFYGTVLPQVPSRQKASIWSKVMLSQAGIKPRTCEKNPLDQVGFSCRNTVLFQEVLEEQFTAKCQMIQKCVLLSIYYL